MKQLIIFAILACVCMVRSAPSTSPPSRQLILQDYNDEVLVTGDANDESDEIDTTTTTTTTTTKTTRRSPYVFPTRTRETPATRRRTRVPTTSTTSAIDVDDVMNEYENSGNYNGDFRYFRNIRDFIKKIFQDLKKVVQNLNLADIIKIIQQFFNRRQED